MIEQVVDMDGSNHRTASVSEPNSSASGNERAYVRYSISSLLPSMTESDFNAVCWPQLRDACSTLLIRNKDGKKPFNSQISFQDMYSCVYKCVCQQYGDRLYQCLVEHVSGHAQVAAEDLENFTGDDAAFVNEFHETMQHFTRGTYSISLIFNYMDRYFVSKFPTTLNDQLDNVFKEVVCNRLVARLVECMSRVLDVPFAVMPSVMHHLITQLHKWDPSYCQLNAALFSRYVPEVLEPTTVSQLDDNRLEAERIRNDVQRDAAASATFDGQRRRKRSDSGERLSPPLQKSHFPDVDLFGNTNSASGPEQEHGDQQDCLVDCCLSDEMDHETSHNNGASFGHHP